MAFLFTSFCIIFSVAFVAVLVTLRVPAEERALDRRLASLQLSARANTADGLETLIRSKRSSDEGKSAWFQQWRVIRTLEQLVYQSTGSRSIRSTIFSALLAFLVGIAVVLFVSGLAPVAAIAGVLLGVLPLVRLHILRQKRVKAFEQALPECIDMCARSLRAGHSLVAAIGIAAEDAPEPARTEFAEIFRKQNYGLPMREALMETLERVPSADFRVFVTGILVQKDTGGNLTEVFDRIVLVIRERLRIQGEIRVHTTQGRLTGWILTLLPVGLLVVINLINPGYSRPLFTDPTGKKLLYAGMLLLLVGGAVIRRIVNGIEV